MPRRGKARRARWRRSGVNAPRGAWKPEAGRRSGDLPVKTLDAVRPGPFQSGEFEEHPVRSDCARASVVVRVSFEHAPGPPRRLLCDHLRVGGCILIESEFLTNLIRVTVNR